MGSSFSFQKATLVIVCMVGLTLIAGSPLASEQANSQAAAFPIVTIQLYSAGFSAPVQITHNGKDANRTYVVEQGGKVRLLIDGVVQPEAFLDITDRVLFNGEQGLLSAAFPPGYSEKGYVYVYYTTKEGNNRVSRFTLTADPDRADPGSEQLVLFLEHPTYSNHNGGQIVFGPEGYLYIGTGDGGGAGDPSENAQDLSSLQGKILRIDIEGGINPYEIPGDNPFIGRADARGEIWALGLRNPWRFSFDRLTGDLFIGDVGQDRIEEVDFQAAGSPGGENYGWDVLEGSLCYEPPTGCVPPAGNEAPIAEYEQGPGNSIGCSVTGGAVYRGVMEPELTGIYFYGDFCTGRLWGLRKEGVTWTSSELLDTSLRISAFGEDLAGELYLVNYQGSIYRLITFNGNEKVYLPLVVR